MPDLTILERLQALSPKVNSPERLAILQSYGVENYADAGYLNLIIEALKDIYDRQRIVATYAAMMAAGAPADGVREYTVINDENKGLAYTRYNWYSTGVRTWVAVIQEN